MKLTRSAEIPKGVPAIHAIKVAKAVLGLPRSLSVKVQGNRLVWTERKARK